MPISERKNKFLHLNINYRESKAFTLNRDELVMLNSSCCFICDDEFVSLQETFVHLRGEHGVFNCLLCVELYASQADLEDHILKKHIVFFCIRCSFLGSLENYEVHKRNRCVPDNSRILFYKTSVLLDQQPKASPRLKCTLCSVKLHDFKTIEVHSLKSHGLSLNDLYDVKLISIPPNSFKSLVKAVDLTVLKNQTSELQLTLCGFCKVPYDSLSLLDQHLRRRHKHYPCNLCLYSTTSDLLLFDHAVKYHGGNGIKPEVPSVRAAREAISNGQGASSNAATRCSPATTSSDPVTHDQKREPEVLSIRAAREAMSNDQGGSSNALKTRCYAGSTSTDRVIQNLKHETEGIKPKFLSIGAARQAISNGQEASSNAATRCSPATTSSVSAAPNQKHETEGIKPKFLSIGAARQAISNGQEASSNAATRCSPATTSSVSAAPNQKHETEGTKLTAVSIRAAREVLSNGQEGSPKVKKTRGSKGSTSSGPVAPNQTHETEGKSRFLPQLTVGESIECNHCSFKGNNPLAFIDHYRARHQLVKDKAPQHCPECKFSSSSNMGYYQHLQSRHNMFKCAWCDTGFEASDQLKDHLLTSSCSSSH